MTDLLQRIRDSLAPHYSDCDRFNTYDYGLRQGNCDCTAAEDMEQVLNRIDAVRKLADALDAEAAELRQRTAYSTRADGLELAAARIRRVLGGGDYDD